MPGLIDEMRDDLHDVGELVREFVVLPSRGVSYGVGKQKKRCHYFASEHEDMDLMTDWLEEMHLIRNVSTGTLQVFRFSAEFAGWLRESYSDEEAAP